MRTHIKGEYFPPKCDIVARIVESKSLHIKRYIEFIELYYNYIFSIANMLGFDLIRLRFYEMTAIIHRPNSTTWIFDFSSNLTNV